MEYIANCKFLPIIEFKTLLISSKRFGQISYATIHWLIDCIGLIALATNISKVKYYEPSLQYLMLYEYL